MSGISGILSLDAKPVNSEQLSLMTSRMRHRGPDGLNTWYENEVALGHCLLKTTPESFYERQPHRDKNFVIVADARIDNRQELLDKLDLSQTGSVIPDNELILHSYEKWGRECPEFLIGDFAFAIWDSAQKSLFLARDPLGIKQLFFHIHPVRHFAFATEIKSLLALPEVSGDLNKQVLAEFLSGWPNPEETIYHEIVRLLPGHAMLVGSRTFEVWQYYQLKPANLDENLSDEEYAHKFLAIFTEAVRARTRSAFPVGAELSGGLDSSFVTMTSYNILQESGQLPLHSFSTVYEKFKESDERDYIEKIVEGRDITSHFTVADREDLFSLLDDIFTYLDDGRVAGNHYLNWLTLREAGNSDVRVLLTGQDGDSVVSHGWRYFSELAKNEKWAEFASEANLTINNLATGTAGVRSQEQWESPEDILSAYAGHYLAEWAKQGRFIKLFRSLYAMQKYFSIDSRYILRKLLRKMIIPSFVWRIKDKRSSQKFDIPKVLQEKFVSDTDLSARLQEMNNLQADERDVRNEQLQLLKSPYIYSNFEKIDMYAAAFGVEARHPFMDVRLIEFCLGLPSNQSYADGWSRIIMRRAMEGIVPNSIRWRPDKADLSEPLQFLFFQNNDQTICHLLKTDGELSDLLNLDTLKSLYDNKTQLSPQDLSVLMKSVNILYWLQKQSEKEYSSAA